MTLVDAIILGILQGLTEFFPVSSSGHLVIGQAVLGINVPGILFDVFVHLGTLVAVLTVYRERVGRLISGVLVPGPEGSRVYLLKLVVATIPAVVVGFGFEDWFTALFDDAVFAATMILVTGTVVWSTRWATGYRRFATAEAVPLLVAAAISLYAGTLVPFLVVAAVQVAIMVLARSTAPKEVHSEPTWAGAAIIGVAQALAILPGISRSGSTVVAGLWRRIDGVAAAEFSFLMSIPAILGAAVLQAPEAMSSSSGISGVSLAAGFIAAAVSGVLAIRFFVSLLRRQSFYWFAYYCWLAAGLFLIFG